MTTTSPATSPRAAKSGATRRDFNRKFSIVHGPTRPTVTHTAGVRRIAPAE